MDCGCCNNDAMSVLLFHRRTVVVVVPRIVVIVVVVVIVVTDADARGANDDREDAGAADANNATILTSLLPAIDRIRILYRSNRLLSMAMVVGVVVPLLVVVVVVSSLVVVVDEYFLVFFLRKALRNSPSRIRQKCG